MMTTGVLDDGQGANVLVDGSLCMYCRYCVCACVWVTACVCTVCMENVM